MHSILISIKKALGLEVDYTHFDTDIIMYINSVFMSLNQLGLGPTDGFSIKDEDDLWSDFIDDRTDLTALQTYVFLKVRLLFDPPSTSFVIAAIERQIQELEWRLNHQMEGVE